MTRYLLYGDRIIQICRKSRRLSLCGNQEGGELFKAIPIKGNYLMEERIKRHSTSENHHSKSEHGN